MEKAAMTPLTVPTAFLKVGKGIDKDVSWFQLQGELLANANVENFSDLLEVLTVLVLCDRNYLPMI